MGGADEYLPAFSPDSTRLVFARSSSGATDVVEIPVAPTGVGRTVTQFASESLTGLAWQPAVKPYAGAIEIDETTGQGMIDGVTVSA